MAVSVRYHREDPWERLRLAAAMPNTPLTFLTTGTRFISWTPAGEDVLELAFATVVRNGVRRFQICTPATTCGRCTRSRRLPGAPARGDRAGADLLGQPGPRRRALRRADRRADGCADADRFYLKDPGGLLAPERARSSSRCSARAPASARRGALALHDRASRRWSTSRRSGPARRRAHRGAPAGLRELPALRGDDAAQPRRGGVRHTASIEQALARTAAYFAALAARKGLPTAEMPEYDAAYYRHQLPGGMATTMRRQLEEMRRGDLFDAALDEVARVRAELGYPIMVTPLSQFVATQAVMNLLAAERYANVPDEVVRMALGQFGEPAAPPDPAVLERILSQPRAQRAPRGRAALAGGGARAIRPPHHRRGAAAAPDDAGRAGRRDARRRAPRPSRRAPPAAPAAEPAPPSETVATPRL